MTSRQGNIGEKIKTLTMSSLGPWRRYLGSILDRVRPRLPRILNLMVNDICNSRCKMCLIWTRKQEECLTPRQLSHILDDPLFSCIEYVGVSGGEPTLRTDLPEIFQVISKKRGVTGTGLITNAIEWESVIDRIEACHRICRRAGVTFNVMLSLDGIGKVHDTVRGCEGNFSSAVKVIRHIRDRTDIPLSIGCTVIKENVWHLNEVLEFCMDEGVHGRFRIGEHIRRLYNEGVKDCIRTFDDDERYQIALFFSKLELGYEKSASVKATYRNIRGMIFEDKPRESGCPFRSEALGLDSMGNLIFCSPKSPVLGSCLQRSAKQIYQKSQHLRRAIIAKHCSDCIHDYHAMPPQGYLAKDEEERLFRENFSVDEALMLSAGIASAKEKVLDRSTLESVFIIGWYGTETVGDKAILGEISYRLRRANPKVHIDVSSLYPFVTRRTLKELGVENVGIVETYSSAFLSRCRTSGAVIMGGGPLMHIEALGFALRGFSAARQSGVPTIIDGCGIGPLVGKKYASAVKEILRLSSEIKVRDKESLAWITRNTQRRTAICEGDPARGFVERWMGNHAPLRASKNSGFVACFFRELTREYSGLMAGNEFAKSKKDFEDGLGKMILFLQERTGFMPLFVPMHTFFIGGDDLSFARRFAGRYLGDTRHETARRVYSPEDVLSIMVESQLNVCMRFHSVLFAETLNVPFMAIDYTGGGKIRGFLRDRAKEHLMIDRTDICESRWKQQVERILEAI